MMTKGFGMGFFGRIPFGTDERKEMFEKWLKMTDEEKLECMNKRMEAMNSSEREFTVEAIDKRCEEWLKKTPEEKDALLKEKKEMMEKFHNHFHNHAYFFGHGRGFGGDDRCFAGAETEKSNTTKNVAILSKTDC